MINASASAQLNQLFGQSPASQSRNVINPENQRVSASEGRASARDELNMQVLQASANVSLKAGDRSQALLFRSAIDRINEVLTPTLGPDAIQSKMGEDNSAEATAGRIYPCRLAFLTPTRRNIPMTIRISWPKISSI